MKQKIQIIEEWVSTESVNLIGDKMLKLSEFDSIGELIKPRKQIDEAQ